MLAMVANGDAAGLVHCAVRFAPIGECGVAKKTGTKKPRIKRGFLLWRVAYTLKRKCITSPSLTM